MKKQDKTTKIILGLLISNLILTAFCIFSVCMSIFNIEETIFKAHSLSNERIERAIQQNLKK